MSVTRHRFLTVQLLTVSRMPLALAFALVLGHYDEFEHTDIIALAILIVAELTDLIDGRMARKYGVVSYWGKIFDPYVDSISRLIIFWSLAIYGMAPYFVPLIMVFRDITVAYSRVICAHRKISPASNWSGKLKAVVQGAGAMALILAVDMGAASTSLVSAVSIAITLVTLISLVEYLRVIRKELPDLMQ